MDKYDINDKRSDSDFKGVSFSGYKKNEVKRELLDNLLKNKIENSCNWSAELICSGHYMDLWELILLYFSKYIHIGNPKLPIYIAMRFENFRTILKNGYVGNELSMRNNEKIRKLFCEIICNLCLSNKRHSFEKIKVKSDDFDMTHFSEKLKAPNVTYIKDIFTENDPKELYIPLNELGYCIETNNCLQACYWIEWILEFENICKKKKEKCNASYRTFVKVENKYQNDIIWIVWEIILEHVKENKPLKKIIDSLLDLFSICYLPTLKRRRVYILYHSISLCCESINYNIPLFKNKEMVEAVCNKINIIYKEIKKNEESTNTDYLFNTNSEKSNTEKTIERLNAFNTMDNFI